MIFLVSWVCEWWIFVLNITPFTSYLSCFHLCGSVFGIRIHKIPEYGSNLDPDPKHCLCLTILPHPPGTWRPTPRWTISSPTPPTGKSMKSYAAPRWTISSPTPPTSTVWYSAILRSQSVFGQLRISDRDSDPNFNVYRFKKQIVPVFTFWASSGKNAGYALFFISGKMHAFHIFKWDSGF